MHVSLKFPVFFLIAGLVFLGAGCSGNQAPAHTQSKPAKPALVVKKAPGLTLIEGSGCQTCHQFKEKLIGPSYEEVAKKYAEATPETVSMLVTKIIEGGVGNWGEIPMTPHPQLDKKDVETMVQYILEL